MSLLALICPLCGSKMVLRQTTKFTYKDGSPRKFWGCSSWPNCKSTVGAHPDGMPIGRPGTPEEREARKEAHAAFDALWTGGAMSRFAAYGWLSNQLGLTRDECHIGFFDEPTCKRVVAVCAAWQRDRAWKPTAIKKPKLASSEPGTYTAQDGTLVVGENHGPVTALIPLKPGETPKSPEPPSPPNPMPW